MSPVVGVILLLAMEITGAIILIDNTHVGFTPHTTHAPTPGDNTPTNVPARVGAAPVCNALLCSVGITSTAAP